MSAIVYFGDAPRDVKVSGIPGIPVIGIGRRIDDLRAMGVRYVFRDYADATGISRVLSGMKKSRRTGGSRLDSPSVKLEC